MSFWVMDLALVGFVGMQLADLDIAISVYG